MAGRRGLIAIAAALLAGAALADPPSPAPGSLRVATFNMALNRPAPGALVQEFRLGESRQIAAVVEIVQRVRPDILLAQEIDHDPRGIAAALLAEALRTGRNNADPIDYRHVFTAEVNTGQPTGFDLDGDGRTDGPRDAFGYGTFPGQYGMAVLSRFPFGPLRSFTRLPWAALPGALIPPDHFPPGFAPRLSSKAHWDLAVDAPAGRLRLLASHPTPPVFDGPEDLNGRRNADEIEFWTAYLSGASWMTDDAGATGGEAGDPVVVLGDLNADPVDGDGRREAMRVLLAHPRLQDARPASAGGAAAADAGHRGDPALDTAQFRGPGALRVDHVLPDRRLVVTGSGVFWPAPGDPLRRLVGEGDPVVGSDHRLVWVDIRLP